jgi:hypothetical protein
MRNDEGELFVRDGGRARDLAGQRAKEVRLWALGLRMASQTLGLCRTSGEWQMLRNAFPPCSTSVLTQKPEGR